MCSNNSICFFDFANENCTLPTPTQCCYETIKRHHWCFLKLLLYLYHNKSRFIPDCKKFSATVNASSIRKTNKGRIFLFLILYKLVTTPDDKSIPRTWTKTNFTGYLVIYFHLVHYFLAALIIAEIGTHQEIIYNVVW